MDVLFGMDLDPGRLVLLVLLLLATSFGALSTGMALARGWRPIWQVWVYCLLLGLVYRFLLWGLFYPAEHAEFVWPLFDSNKTGFYPWGFWVDTVLFLAIGTAAYLVTRATRMTAQYPWLYERAGLTGWRAKSGGPEGS